MHDLPEALVQLGRVIVGEHVDDVVLRRALEERFGSAPPHIARRLKLGITILDHPIANLLATGRFARLSLLAPSSSLRGYERWLTTRVSPLRSIAHGIRRFVLSAYYAQPEAQAALGILPPLHQREPRYAWEGPLQGARQADEPVARSDAPIPEERRHPPKREIPSGVHSALGWKGTHYFRADVAIVGSGAGGAVAAARLAEAGRDVLVIERGRYVSSADFTEREHDIGAALFADCGLRTTDDQAFTLLQGGALGGGTTVNWMLMLRTPEHVLEEWERGYGTEGMGPSAMCAVFDRVEQETHATVVPDDAHSPANRMLIDGARTLGWHVSSARINARGCVRAGTCSLGCRYGAKMSALEVYLPRARAAGARILTDAVVTKLVVTARDTGKGRPPQKRLYASPRSGNGAEILIDAPIVILAAGAIETPLILQRSGMGGGGVGRFLRLHPTTAVFARAPNETYPLAGVPQTSVCAEFARKADGYGYWIECPALTPGLAGAAVSGIGREHYAQLQQLGNLAPLIALVRDGADGGSNGSVRVGPMGPRIRYQLGERDAQHMREGIAAAARIALAGGANEVVTLHTRPFVVRTEHEIGQILQSSMAPNDVSLFSAHVNGTCRIGRHAREAGVMPNGERFAVRGLYVVDGSILPSAPGVNPQETIYALATVLTERMVAENRL